MKLATLLGAVILAGTGFVASAPAHADLDECWANYTCIWANNDHEGAIARRIHNQALIVNVPAALNNRMDSWANRSATYGSCGYDGANGSGYQQQWNAGLRDNNVSYTNSDIVSSWRTRYGC